jgi:hypothetical protein
MKKIFVAIVLLSWVCSAFSMAGGPLFCVGQQRTSMTVEASKVNLKLSSPDAGNQKTSAMSDRVMLTARYGFAENLDLSAGLGAANLNFSKLEGGFSDYSSDWSLAWSAAFRAGYPVEPKLFQALVTVNYVGFQPNGKTSNSIKSISNKYLWHEVTPTAAVGIKAGPVVPYLGVSKPYLFGRREVSVALRGQTFPAAGSNANYSYKDQPLRGILGIEWRLPEGYSIGAEGATTSSGSWGLSISLAQVLR